MLSLSSAVWNPKIDFPVTKSFSFRIFHAIKFEFFPIRFVIRTHNTSLINYYAKVMQGGSINWYSQSMKDFRNIVVYFVIF